MYILYNDIGPNVSRCVRDVLQIMLRSHVYKNTFFHVINFFSQDIYTFVCYL